MKADFLQNKLEQRNSIHALRELRLPREGMIDFCSNDYLGLSRNLRFRVDIKYEKPQMGSTGSRLLTGNTIEAEQTEKFLASFHETESAIIFNSGYDANIGLLSSVPQKDDTILYDQLSHASIRDGIRLSFAQAQSFDHNDMDDLEKKLKKGKGNIFIVTESIFSMDGDCCPIAELITLSEKYNAALIIDEAHATGVIGEKGEGLIQSLGYGSRVFARIHTFGKACGVHGAAVLGSTMLKQYLVNFARPFVYSTALPPQSMLDIRDSYVLMSQMKAERAYLKQLVEKFRDMFSRFNIVKSGTPVQGLLIPGNLEARRVARSLQDNNLDLRPILYPTVPEGKERLRIILHAFNREEELDLLLNCLENSL